MRLGRLRSKNAAFGVCVSKPAKIKDLRYLRGISNSATKALPPSQNACSAVIMAMEAQHNASSEGTITRVSCSPTFEQKKEKKRPSLEGFLLVFLCLRLKRAPKFLRQTLVTSDTHVSLAKSCPTSAPPPPQNFVKFSVFHAVSWL